MLYLCLRLFLLDKRQKDLVMGSDSGQKISRVHAEEFVAAFKGLGRKQHSAFLHLLPSLPAPGHLPQVAPRSSAKAFIIANSLKEKSQVYFLQDVENKKKRILNYL